MTVITDILDRLSGVAVVRERLADTGKRVDHLAESLLDHERRLTRLEALTLEPQPRGRKHPRRT